MNAVIRNTLSPQTLSFGALQTKNKVDAIAFSIGTTDIGCVLVARSDIGICAILIGSDADEVRSNLTSRFPGSNLVHDDEALCGDLEKVTHFVRTPHEGLDLPLDIRGTPFQRRVWEALLTVRVGAVITYAALARRIGQPNAVRAVASACANNPLALAIPCHRVVRTNGALGQYRWGILRKRALINREAMA
jgi:O-6-methylguanine DNA methyltransferase